MIALKNDRDISVINVLLKVGCDIDAKSKDKRTPLMYAARFSSKEDVVERLITAGTIFSSGRKKRVLAKDKTGRTSFDYVKKNPAYAAIHTVLLKYAEEPQSSVDDTPAQTAETSTPTPTTTTTSTVPTDPNKMHTVTATFTGSPVTDDNTITPEPETTAVTTTAPVVASTTPNASVTPAATSTTTNIPAATDDSTTSAKETSPSTPAAVQTTEDAVPAQTYDKSYLYEYMKDETPTAPSEDAKEAPSSIADVNSADKNGVTLLMKAAKAGNDWDVQNLLNLGADVQARDKDGWSALMYAVRYQNSIHLVNMLIEKGAHTRVRNKYNATPLLLAANYSQNPQILSLMLRNRSNTEDEVYKAFILALSSNEGSDHIQTTKIQLFLDMGISVNRVWKGKTPLMYASQYSNSTAIIKLLLSSGAKPGVQSVDGKTAFDYAKENNNLAHDDTYWALNSVDK